MPICFWIVHGHNGEAKQLQWQQPLKLNRGDTIPMRKLDQEAFCKARALSSKLSVEGHEEQLALSCSPACMIEI